jgi:hypothetical protein
VDFPIIAAFCIAPAAAWRQLDAAPKATPGCLWPRLLALIQSGIEHGINAFVCAVGSVGHWSSPQMKV